MGDVMARARISEAQKLEVVAFLRRGPRETRPEIANRFGVKPWQITRICREYGLKMMNGRPPRKQWPDVEVGEKGFDLRPIDPSIMIAFSHNLLVAMLRAAARVGRTLWLPEDRFRDLCAEHGIALP